jgi:hypothetical protein
MNRRIAMTIALGKFTKDEKDLFADQISGDNL